MSASDLAARFDYAGDPDRVVIDLAGTRIRDASSVAALDAVESTYAQHGKSVEFTGLDDASARLRGRLREAVAPAADV